MPMCPALYSATSRAAKLVNPEFCEEMRNEGVLGLLAYCAHIALVNDWGFERLEVEVSPSPFVAPMMTLKTYETIARFAG